MPTKIGRGNPFHSGAHRVILGYIIGLYTAALLYAVIIYIFIYTVEPKCTRVNDYNIPPLGSFKNFIPSLRD